MKFFLIKNVIVLLAFLSLSSVDGQENVEVINQGRPGNTTTDLLKRLNTDVLSEEPDIVIIMVGTNDMVNSKKMVSYNTYVENYKSILKELNTRGISLILMSPPPVDTSYLFKRHERSVFKESPNEKIDSLARIINRLAIEHNSYFIDINALFKKMGSPNRNRSSLILNKVNSGKEDGVHPTSKGYSLIAQQVFDLLKREKLLKGSVKIVCFGDSITYGAYMKGEGTAEGETYPAYLMSLINHKIQ